MCVASYVLLAKCWRCMRDEPLSRRMHALCLSFFILPFEHQTLERALSVPNGAVGD